MPEDPQPQSPTSGAHPTPFQPPASSPLLLCTGWRAGGWAAVQEPESCEEGPRVDDNEVLPYPKRTQLPHLGVWVDR